jgi:phosphoribosylformylglycinamidine synthase
VLEVDPRELDSVRSVLDAHGLSGLTYEIGETTANKEFEISRRTKTLFTTPLSALNAAWSELTYRMQAIRDNPECAREEFETLTDPDNNGLLIHPSYDAEAERKSHAERFNIGGSQPRIAVLREQGTNGQNEMAFAFHRAGFEAVDLHMTDLLAGSVQLDGFSGLVACGGFSYGDVLGAGSGWAKSILYNATLKDQFAAFFARPDSFSLGVCNGCQMLAQLKGIIPGAEAWPKFVRNRSEQFEARYANVEVLESPSLFLSGMAGSLLPIPVAHGEGRADFTNTGNFEQCRQQKLIGLRYIDAAGLPASSYPANPNGSPDGATAFSTVDGRVTIMMPHPERCFRSVQMSYRPKDSFEGEAGPWLKLFENARSFLA